MSMPTGDSPRTAQEYYHYLQSHQLTPHGRVATWHVDWNALGWMWGFVAILVVILLLWARQYRTTRSRTGISPIDSFGGYTSELAGPATVFFLVLAAIVAISSAVIIIGHLISGQVF
jgi:hypothetical protein